MPILRDQTDTILADLLAALHHETLAPADPARLVQDLQIHQIELELQNRELREAQRALEESRDRYVELYDLAPVAYATLSREGRITQMNLAAAIAGICGEVGVHPGCLAVEITETWIMTNPDLAAATIQRLQALGIAVGIDDFGTGYSSLAALKRLGVHEIKIDRSFVAGLPQDPDDCAIARAMIALGRALGLRVVAEWVETQAQADFLKAEGCGIGQGYLFSAALPAAQFEVYARGGTPV